MGAAKIFRTHRRCYRPIPAMKNLTAVVPTLSNRSGLAHLKRECAAAGVPLVIVDNSRKNRGFAAAVNTGAGKVSTPWLLLVNDDVERIRPLNFATCWLPLPPGIGAPYLRFSSLRLG